MAQGNRPLSPHLQIYRPQITSVLSILHRLTGVVLAPGAVLLVYWLLAAAAGPADFATAQSLMGSTFGTLVLVGFSYALFYHLCNGIRHLCWDAGWGFDLNTAYASGWAMVAVSIALTAAAWAFGLTVLARTS
ncbi:MAG: succinate dehydrogenase, cytochrome b556 subunit [Alphaproteobacteria bacterium]